MDLALYYKKSEPVLGVAKILFSRLFELFDNEQISEIAKSTSGGTPNRGNSEYYQGNIPWLKSGELNDSYILKSEEFISDEGLKNSSAKLFPKETLLVAMYGATAGKTGILKIEAATNQAVCAIFPFEDIERDYLFWFLKQHRIDFILQSKGGAQPNISQKVIKETKIPVPPLEIQKKVIEFLNDVKEKNYINKKFEILDDVTIERINQFYQTRKVNETLNQKFQSQKQLLSQLKQSILQEAIQGKLTEGWRSQNPDVEPASELLKRIKAEKAQLIKDKKIRKEKPLPPITEDQIPFELPDGWVWCRFVDIAEIARGGSPRPIGNYLTNDENGINWIKIGDTKNDDKFINSTREKIKPEGMKKSRFVEPGDFLLTNSMSFGRPYIMRTTGCIHDGWLLIRYTKTFIEQDYLYSMLSSKYVYDSFKETARGGVVQNLNIDKARATIIPIPPLSEQQAIIEKVESLMEKCHALEQEIQTSESNAQMLMQAVLKEAFEGKQEVVEV